MKIAVLSGKGGTGKTFVSASMSVSLPSCQYIDCDVEEPNGGIFLSPEFKEKSLVKVLVPKTDIKKCKFCGSCAKACQFNAIAVIKEKVLIFPEICHHCGACVIACKNDALSEEERVIGVIEASQNDEFLQGKLNIGEPVSIPVLRDLKKRVRNEGTVILDCSPGASCAVVESVEGCDFCILVTEPTPFGLHDLIIAVSLIRKMKIPFGIILNKASDKSGIIHEFCENEGIDLLMEIPYSKKIAEDYSKGILSVRNDDSLKAGFIKMYERAERIVKNETGSFHKR